MTDDEFEQMIATTVARMDAPVTVCEDCGNASNLGKKCRACWGQWRSMLYDAVPREQARIVKLAADMRELPREAKRAALLIAGRRESGPVGGAAAEFVMRARQVLDGPFRSSMQLILDGWVNRKDETTRERGRLDD